MNGVLDVSEIETVYGWSSGRVHPPRWRRSKLGANDLSEARACVGAGVYGIICADFPNERK